ncbi:MAG: head GIN domain-containing protein [Massilia sp.]
MTARPLPCRRLALMFAATLAATAILPANSAFAWGNNVDGNGRIKTEARTATGFHGVSMSLPGSVELRIGNAESVTVETDDNLLPLIETVVENGVLQIRTVKRNTGLSSRHMKFIVQARSIDRLALGGSGNINADTARGSKVSIDLGGSGNINLKNVEAESLSVDLGGSGDLKVDNGRAAQLSLAIAGSGNIDLGRVQSRVAKASIAGSGEATINVSEQLDASIVGSGDVNYYGDPRVTKSVMGSGSTNRVGARR